jgi:hypothetical protein
LIGWPPPLRPNAVETIALPQGPVELPKACVHFKLWTSAPLADTYGHKAALDWLGEPVFAELAILRAFQADGWEGRWVDSYRRQYRTQLPGKPSVALPDDREALLSRLRKATGAYGGCFDVFCWKGGDIRFIEAKRSRRDAIRGSQKAWLEAALAIGLTPQMFLIVEWTAD